MPNVVEHHGTKAFECFFFGFLSIDLDTDAFIGRDGRPHDFTHNFDLAATFTNTIEHESNRASTWRDSIGFNEEADRAQVSSACIVDTSMSCAQANRNTDLFALGAASL